MNQPEHQRAIDLIAADGIEGISGPDAGWLQQHLAGCADCAGFAEALGLAQQTLCAVPVTASAELVAATQARVRIRALELREHSARVALVAISATLGAIVSALTLAYAWPTVVWVAARLRMPPLVVESGFILTWFLPATIVAFVLIALRPGRAPHASSFSPAPAGDGGSHGR